MKGTRYKNKTIEKNSFYISLTKVLITIVLMSVVSCTSSEEKPTDPIQPEPIAQVEIPEPVLQPPEPEIKPVEVSEEVYAKTFADIEALINKLNKIIKASNFAQWRINLTPNYINYYSDRAKLREISSTPILKKFNITLETLKDYFIYVVSPSRSDVRLDDISFIDDNNVKAYMNIAGEDFVIYTLTRQGNNWKIGL